MKTDYMDAFFHTFVSEENIHIIYCIYYKATGAPFVLVGQIVALGK